MIKYFKNFQTIGFELPQTLSFLKEKYPDRHWLESDFSVWDIFPEFDVVICSDVVEHLVDPDQLLNWIRKLQFRYLVISTPDRDKLLYFQKTNQSQTGPPVNPCHIREWSFAEFEKYISQYFDIVDHFHTKKEWWGQTIVAAPKSD